MKVIQARLQQNNAYLTTWIDYRKDLKIGCFITLKGEKGLWEVIELYHVKEKDTIHTDWHVGGL